MLPATELKSASKPRTRRFGFSISQENRRDFNRQVRLSRCRVPSEFLANHVEECAAIDILPLQTAGQDIGPHEPATRGQQSRILNQVVIPPAAAIKSLTVPAHRGVQTLNDAVQVKQRAI